MYEIQIHKEELNILNVPHVYIFAVVQIDALNEVKAKDVLRVFSDKFPAGEGYTCSLWFRSSTYIEVK